MAAAVLEVIVVMLPSESAKRKISGITEHKTINTPIEINRDFLIMASIVLKPLF